MLDHNITNIIPYFVDTFETTEWNGFYLIFYLLVCSELCSAFHSIAINKQKCQNIGLSIRAKEYKSLFVSSLTILNWIELLVTVTCELSAIDIRIIQV